MLSLLAKTSLYYIWQDSLSGCLFITKYSVSMYLKKYHPSLVQKCTVLTSQLNAWGNRRVWMSLLSSLLTQWIYQCIHLLFVGLWHSLMDSELISSVTPNLQRNFFCLVPWEPLPNETINHLPNKMKNFQLMRLKKLKLSVLHPE